MKGINIQFSAEKDLIDNDNIALSFGHECTEI